MSALVLHATADSTDPKPENRSLESVSAGPPPAFHLNQPDGPETKE